MRRLLRTFVGKQTATAFVTPGVKQNVDPTKWSEHNFGLTPARWKGLQGKNFWITGAGTGYGRCLAVALAAAGGRVFLTGRRHKKLLESLTEMKSLGISTDNCHPVQADLTDVEEITRACRKIESLCPSLYGLINNAAIPSRANLPYPLQDETPEYWECMLRTNVTAPWFLTRSIFPHMKKNGAARVLFMTSEAGWAFTPGVGPYNVSKAALNNLAGSMAAEYAVSFPEVDIQINTLVPGEAKTEMNQNSTESPYSAVSMALILLSHPIDGPNGKFFHRDGRHLQFAYASAYDKFLM